MGEPSTNAKATGLIPMAHVADVQRSVDFYKMLGMELRSSLKGSTNGLQWAHVACEGAHLMFARASEPVVASQQAVLFYLYSPDLICLARSLARLRSARFDYHVSRLHGQGRSAG
jgi:catechol 2,3-dioxygenase-like lactoylglutathione lyase family enzyme